MDDAGTAKCAQTNVQLYNQLVAAGWDEQDLARARSGYELALELFTTRYRGNGKPFVAHLIGVASLLERSGSPRSLVLAGLLHSAYPQGTFGTGQQGPSEEHRARVRAAIGSEAEQLVERYSGLKDGGAEAAVQRLRDGEVPDAVARGALLIELFDTLEEHLDFGLLYCRKGEHAEVDPGSTLQIELARLLGRPDLAVALEEAAARTLATDRPAVLITDRAYSFNVVPSTRRAGVLDGLRARFRLKRLGSLIRRAARWRA